MKYYTYTSCYLQRHPRLWLNLAYHMVLLLISRNAIFSQIKVVKLLFISLAICQLKYHQSTHKSGLYKDQPNKHVIQRYQKYYFDASTVGIQCKPRTLILRSVVILVMQSKCQYYSQGQPELTHIKCLYNVFFKGFKFAILFYFFC